MTYVLPERTHLVHKAIDIEKLSTKNQPTLNPETGLPSHKLYSWEKKYDGCCVIVVVDQSLDVTYWSRDGKPCTSLGHLTSSLQRLPPGTVLFAEAWAPGYEFRELSGAFRRKAVQEHLGLKVFDTVRLHQFDEGYSNTPYATRRTTALGLVYRCADSLISLSNTCQPWEVGELAKQEDAAYDGAVAKLLSGEWRAGAGTGGEVLKVKNIIDLDLRCVGIEEEYDKHGRPKGRLGAIKVAFEDTTLGVGTGFNDAARVTYWKEPEKIVGQIVRVVGMKASGKGSLREPRFKGIRYDKDTADH